MHCAPRLCYFSVLLATQHVEIDIHVTVATTNVVDGEKLKKLLTQRLSSSESVMIEIDGCKKIDILTKTMRLLPPGTCI